MHSAARYVLARCGFLPLFSSSGHDGMRKPLLATSIHFIILHYHRSNHQPWDSWRVCSRMPCVVDREILKTPGPLPPQMARIPRLKANTACTVHYETINGIRGISNYMSFIPLITRAIMRACTTIIEEVTGVGVVGVAPHRLMGQLVGFIPQTITLIDATSLQPCNIKTTHTEFGMYLSNVVS